MTFKRFQHGTGEEMTSVPMTHEESVMHWVTPELPLELALRFAGEKAALTGQLHYVIRGPNASRVTSAKPYAFDFHYVVHPNGVYEIKNGVDDAQPDVREGNAVRVEGEG